MIEITDEGIYSHEVALPASAPAFVYLTRDAHEETGALSPVVDVWAAAPYLSAAPDGAPGRLWLGHDPEHPDAPDVELLTRVTAVGAAKHWPTLPETPRECIRIRK